MENFKSHFVFNRSQRNGILFLILLIVGLFCVNYFVDFSEENILNANSSEVIAIQKELDSLRTAEIATRKPKTYPFNPNFITDFKGYTLGMSSEEIDRLKHFRDKDQWVNSIKDFQKVTKVSDSLLAEISPFFKFPDWVTNPKPKKKYYKNKGFKEKSFQQKIDLNKATQEQLKQVSGIGEALSKRIITYRQKLGEFSNDSQLYNVYGLNPEVVKRTLNEFTVKTPKVIVKMNLNEVSASDIATIPGISFELAKKIWEFRTLRGQINDFSELEKIDGISQRKLKGIQLYLTLD
ncbi:MAG: helix-hairpin-helix domain-containing protein [Flavobacteriaceae bacterium]|nr:helix-hairpin-helix domain-containing protein [Flavobacteriaceae bacterium]